MFVLIGCIPGAGIRYSTFDVTSDFGTGHDIPYALVVDGDSMFIAGSIDNGGDNEWQIEKRAVLDGALDLAFDSDGIITVAAQNSGEYLQARAITMDAAHIYVGGVYHDGNTQYDWRIEKRDKVTGALEITSFNSGTGFFTTHSYFSSDNRVNDLLLAGSTLYAGGGQDNANLKFQVETVNSTTGSVSNNWVNDGTSDTAQSLATDGSALFAAGSSNNRWRLDKRDLTSGNLDSTFGTAGKYLPVQSGDSAIYDLAVDSGYIFAAGYEYVGSEDFQWRVDKVSTTNGAL
jgi:hypothetical protein